MGEGEGGSEGGSGGGSEGGSEGAVDRAWPLQQSHKVTHSIPLTCATRTTSALSMPE